MGYKPQEVTKLDIAFGGKAMELLPPDNDIPDEFNQWHNKWGDVVSKWFFNGLPKDTEFVPVDGIDTAQALAHIQAILGSFEPKHEHKMAGCAYLMSLWFKDVKFPKPAKKAHDNEIKQKEEQNGIQTG